MKQHGRLASAHPLSGGRSDDTRAKNLVEAFSSVPRHMANEVNFASPPGSNDYSWAPELGGLGGPGHARRAGAGQVRNRTGGECLGINQTDRRQTGKGTAWTVPDGGWTGSRPVRSSEKVRATKVRNRREQARGLRAGASVEAAGEPRAARGAADRNRFRANLFQGNNTCGHEGLLYHRWQP
ncbi:hypothetical protein SKAU_G00008270 [Synaphobranchus kaupii]|uniref:Uncharacterized protein n=1 Tax=Synaphobranchus kaupii TaxID=118154 RepID=A0A9Q1GAP4_SYNKA|nr:hypothetical protein SKAU_G00008270 [Synaphobranchus kaupii]